MRLRTGHFLFFACATIIATGIAAFATGALSLQHPGRYSAGTAQTQRPVAGATAVRAPGSRPMTLSEGPGALDGSHAGSSLSDELSAIARRSKLAFKSVAQQPHAAAPVSGTKLSESVASVAGKNMPVGGDIAGLDAGKAGQIVLSDVGIYVGSNAGVIRSLSDLSGRDSQKRSDAVDSIASCLREENLEPIVVGVLDRDSDADVRAAAAKALEDAQRYASIDALIRALGDRNDLVREQARASLGLIKGPIVHERLREARKGAAQEAREIMDQILEEAYGDPLSSD